MSARPERLQLLATQLAGRKRRSLMSIEGRREAAVLVPIVSTADGTLEVLLTLRSENLSTHKGQVAFPGGGIDPEDADCVEAALREAEEEIGLARAHVDVLGLGDDVFSITGQKVTPVVGHIARLPELKPNPGEIADIFTVPLLQLMDPASFYEHDVQGPSGNVARKVPFFSGGKHQIWGLTAWILRELFTVMTGPS